MSEKDKMKLMMLMSICLPSNIYIMNDIIKHREKVQEEAFIRSVKCRLELLTEEDIEKMATL